MSSASNITMYIVLVSAWLHISAPGCTLCLLLQCLTRNCVSTLPRSCRMCSISCMYCCLPFLLSYYFPFRIIIGSLMTTHTKWMHKLDFPSIDWPIADFPQTRYPVLGNVAQNRREEARCLQQVNSGKQPLGVAGNHLQFFLSRE